MCHERDEARQEGALFGDGGWWTLRRPGTGLEDDPNRSDRRACVATSANGSAVPRARMSSSGTSRTGKPDPS